MNGIERDDHRKLWWLLFFGVWSIHFYVNRILPDWKYWVSVFYLHLVILVFFKIVLLTYKNLNYDNCFRGSETSSCSWLGKSIWMIHSSPRFDLIEYSLQVRFFETHFCLTTSCQSSSKTHRCFTKAVS